MPIPQYREKVSLELTLLRFNGHLLSTPSVAYIYMYRTDTCTRSTLSQQDHFLFPFSFLDIASAAKTTVSSISLNSVTSTEAAILHYCIKMV